MVNFLNCSPHNVSPLTFWQSNVLLKVLYYYLYIPFQYRPRNAMWAKPPNSISNFVVKVSLFWQLVFFIFGKGKEKKKKKKKKKGSEKKKKPRNFSCMFCLIFSFLPKSSTFGMKEKWKFIKESFLSIPSISFHLIFFEPNIENYQLSFQIIYTKQAVKVTFTNYLKNLFS